LFVGLFVVNDGEKLFWRMLWVVVVVSELGAARKAPSRRHQEAKELNW